MDKIHIPVLLNEVVDSLNIYPDGFYIDCTLGDGGHSFEIYKRLSSGGLLVSIDQDNYALDFVRNFYKDSIKDNWIIEKSNFSDIDKVISKFDRKPDGIIMDLGLSSRQLEESHNRGFSYLEEEEDLDMRMNQDLGVTAKDLIHALSEKELTRLFKEYGEEKLAHRIAKEIKKYNSTINTVGDLTRLIYKVVPAAHSTKNPSRRVFQALRIVVNNELENLEIGLDRSFGILNKNGRLCVISFHSLEDRIVKNFFCNKAGSGEGTLLFKSHIAPTDEEIMQNPRSASAKLRVLIKK